MVDVAGFGGLFGTEYDAGGPAESTKMLDSTDAASGEAEADTAGGAAGWAICGRKVRGTNGRNSGITPLAG